MTPVTELVTVLILCGLNTTSGQTRMEHIADGYSYFASTTSHYRNETSNLCSKWNLHDEVNTAQIFRLLYICSTYPHIGPPYQARYWLIGPAANATHAATVNLDRTCIWTQNIVVDSIMHRVICVISRQAEYAGTLPSPEDPSPGSASQSPQEGPPPSGGDITSPPAGPQTELPTSGSILCQIPLKTQFQYMILILVIPLF